MTISEITKLSVNFVNGEEIKMKELTTSGLPIFYDDKGILELGHGLNIQGTGRKTVREMAELLVASGYLPDDETYYDVYRGIMWPKDTDLFKKTNKRYDITAIMESPAEGECKKTSGHFHTCPPGGVLSYPEVYEVLLGTAMYILVRVNDRPADMNELIVEDIRLVTVEAGQTIIIPPGYGHAAINAGVGPMLFNNICTLENKSDYSIIKHFHGMPYYITKKNGEVIPVKNANWTMQLPQPRMMRVRPNPDLGIIFNNPVYHEFIKRPEIFNFLENPSGHVDKIMNMLIDA